MKRTLLIATTMLALAACASVPPKTLDQKLASAATSADRKETLRLACLNEAEWPFLTSYAYKHRTVKTRRYLRHRYNSEVSEMKALCRQMDALTDSTTEKKLPPQELASLCAEKVIVKMQRERKGAAEHAQRIEKICEEMTGRKIHERSLPLQSRP